MKIPDSLFEVRYMPVNANKARRQLFDTGGQLPGDFLLKLAKWFEHAHPNGVWILGIRPVKPQHVVEL